MNNIKLNNITLTPENVLVFKHESTEILKFSINGDIFVKGKLIENDKEIVAALREFLGLSGEQKWFV